MQLAANSSDLTVGVVIPTYNMASYLRGCIDSVLAQTDPPAEVVVVDGGGDDGSRDIVASFGPRITYVRQVGTGLSSARNQGVQRLSSRWVAFLDADDYWLPGKLAMQKAEAARTPDAKLIYCGSLILRENGESQAGTYLEPSRFVSALKYRNAVMPSCVMVNRAAFLAEGGFNESLRAAEDWELWFRLSRRWKFAAVPEPLLVYRVLSSSMSSNIALTTTNEVKLLPLLLAGSSGISRVLALGRFRAMVAYRAALTCRERGSGRMWSYILRSLAYFPFPGFEPVRFKVVGNMLFQALFGPTALRAPSGRKLG